ncbi:MAG: hypothetical protein A2X28_06345 [Elusimicrobia bacterium GWA2_56_46]|nr:MAG: hypothetical protein A2X28_06345 [Elusimicrobia bacterium GWA2_56_46]OGR54925.1 MAG: hypothetical protein A2X39_11645 [Elusimicrobia bacterium GWC2_56_31]HBW23277.1 hypothetical protein [Elusimicrobiota bacterium]
MKLPTEDINCPALHKRYYQYFDFAEKFWAKTSQLLGDKTIVGIGNGTNFNTCICGVFAKQMRLYYGIIKLCGSGLSHESLVLLRTMFYTSTYLLALSKSDDKQKFAKLWVAWNFAIDDRNLTDLPAKKSKETSLTDDLVRYLEEVKTTLPEDKWRAFIENGPPLLNFRDLCKQLKSGGTSFEDSYLTLFRICSSVAHGSDLLFYAQPGDNSITCQLSPSDEGIDKIILTAAVLLRDTCVQIHDLLNLGKEDVKEEIVALFETHKALKIVTDEISDKSDLVPQSKTMRLYGDKMSEILKEL